jgi:hypothetical protein
MTPFVVGMLARPREFRRARSGPLLAAGVALAALSAGWLVTVAVSAATTRLGPFAIAVPAVLVLLVVALRWILVPGGSWTHRPTGSRMRRIGRWTFGERERDELTAALGTGDPRVFLPLPEPEPGGPVWVEAWAADDARIAWVQVVWGPTRAHQRDAPLVAVTDDDYVALVEAEARGSLSAPAAPPRPASP